MDYKALLKKISDKTSENAKNIGAQFVYNDRNGKFEVHPYPYFWTGGYYPGLLWVTYRASGDEILKKTAIELEEKLDKWIIDFKMPEHDVGFVWLLSAGAHNRLEKNPESRKRLLQMANYLAGRFNINSRTIRAWDGADGDKFVQTLAIIDCMMNIPLLFTASNTIGDPRYAHIAKAHADTVLKHFIDEDGAVRHICRFDTETGKFIEAFGGQGYSKTSSWSRGASWAIYGFAMAYRYTGDRKYLEASEKVAKFFINEIKDDYVPAWDFRAPNREVKDASAGAIAASGLLEIYAHTKDSYYKSEAEKIVNALYEKCWHADTHESLLGRCTAFLPAGDNIEVGLIYGDYYFAEAVYKLATGDYSLPWDNSF